MSQTSTIPAAGSWISSSLNHDMWDFSDLILKSRFARALTDGSAGYPVHRSLRFAARAALETLFDEIALGLGWRAQRIDSYSMILDSDGLFIASRGGRKTEYCSCHFGIWTNSLDEATRAQQAILGIVGDRYIAEPMFSIDWHFLTGKGELQSAAIEEMADDVLHDESYPEIKEGVTAFIERYLDAPETVLVLQGPPGTGKTRLIRAILGQISRRKAGHAQALYTGDKKSLETDEIFVKFITGWDDAFVVEDADHLLRPRASGNEHLHRFLAIADGVVRAQGRKIIFSTNLPNIGDLDDALIRPGRCFARVAARGLSPAESELLLAKLCASDTRRLHAALARLQAQSAKVLSLASIYQSVTT
jgi:ATPase family protein associated with various cellular activities (AAA)